MSASPTPTRPSTDLVSLKLTHQGLTRRLSISAHPTPSWATLTTEVQLRFGLAEDARASLGLSYVDEDGDAIVLSSGQELAELWTTLVSEESFTQPKFTVVDLANDGHAAEKPTHTDGHLTDLLSQVRLAVEADPTVAMQLRGVVHEAFAGQHPGPGFGPGHHSHHVHGHPHHFGPRGLGFGARQPPTHADMKAAHQQAREARHLARAARRLAREERRTARNPSDSSLSASEDSSTSDSSSDSEDDRRKGKGQGRGHHYGRHHDLFGPEAGPFRFGHRFGRPGFGHRGLGGHKHGGPHGHHFGGPGGPPGAFPPGPGGPPPPPHAFGGEMPAFGPGHFERGPHHYFGQQHHAAAGFGEGRGGFGPFGGRGGFGGRPGGRHSHLTGPHPGAEAGLSGLHRHMPPPPPFPHPDDIEVEVEGYVVPPAFEEGEHERRHRKGGRHGKPDRARREEREGGRKERGDKEKGGRA